MGGLNGTLTTAQTVGIDFSALSSDNMAERIGDANYSDIQWWLEWYMASFLTSPVPQRRHGHDQRTDLVFLEVIDEISYPGAKPNVRLHQRSPDALMDKVVDMIATSQGAPFAQL